MLHRTYRSGWNQEGRWWGAEGEARFSALKPPENPLKVVLEVLEIVLEVLEVVLEVQDVRF